MKTRVFLSVAVLGALVLFVSWPFLAEAGRDIAKGEAKPAAEVNYYNGGGGGPYQGGGGWNGGGPYHGGGGWNGGGPYHGGGGGYNRGCYHGCCGHYYNGNCRCCATAEEAIAYKATAAKP